MAKLDGATNQATGRARGRGRPVAPAPPPVPWWGGPRGAAALVIVLGLVAYARSLGNDFSYDEGLVIGRAHAFLRSGAYWVLLSKRYFAATFEGTWRPVCTFTYMLDAMVAAPPAVFKAQSLLWHLATACLVMALARRLLPLAHARYATVAGLLFVLHPVTTETVDNASFREDSLVTFFVLATLLLAMRERPLLALGTYALALLSKESAVVAPALLVGIRLVGPEQTRRPGRAAARELVPFAAITVLYLLIRFGPMKIPIAYAAYPGGSLGATLIGMPAVWAHDLRLAALPWPLCADYSGYFRFGPQPAGPVLAALVPLAAFAAALVWAARRGHLVLAFGLAWFAVALAPVSNFIPVPIPAAERFLYLPLVGLALAAAAAAGLLVERLPARTVRVAAALGAVVLGVFAVMVNLRHAAWRDDRALWADTVIRNPRSCGAQSAVGGQLLSLGMEQRSPELLRQSAARQELALTICQGEPDPTRASMAFTRLGAARAMLGELGPAEAALKRAIELWPTYGLPVVWLGYVRFEAGDRDGAAILLKRAVIDLGPPDEAVAQVAQRYVDRL